MEAPPFALDLVAVYRQTPGGRILDCNHTCARMLGYSSREELLSAGRFEYCNASDRDAVAAAMPDLEKLSNLEVSLRRKDGRPVWVLQNLRVVVDNAKPALVVEGVMFDVTEQRVATQTLEHNASHDPLTALPNRGLLLDRLNVALARSKRRGQPVAVLFIDLDRFSAVNSASGPGMGDRVLRSIADRLHQTLRVEDGIARYGGDSFAGVLAEVRTETDAALAAQRVLDRIAEPLEIGDRTFHLTASIGIAVAPRDGAEPEILLRRACDAMLDVAALGGNSYQFHVPELNARAIERAALIASLRRAPARGELELHYHPEVNVQTGRIETIEALLRWKHPDLGYLAPADFLPAAEQGNLDAMLADWTINEACRQAKVWRDFGMKDLRVAVNLSARQLYESELPRVIEQAVLVNHLDGGALVLEIAEPSLAATRRRDDVLDALTRLGTTVSVDDYGSGGCSFADLRAMPVQTLKIAPSFVQNLTTQHSDAAIVSAIITMAKGLDLRVVAEGVETKDQLSHLLKNRCPVMQGYFFGKPVRAGDLTDTLHMQH